MTPKMMKRKTSELEFIKSQNFCSSKGTVENEKTGDWEKMFTSTWNKGLVSRIHKEESHNSITGTT